ncbi:hypothetical protein ACI77O_12045 [Pseudomonas tritici]|uniref:hypothetical protein n=1 Tax=Pseudomonas tritici TaxID=2745518 RepID=UPI00387B643D
MDNDFAEWMYLQQLVGNFDGLYQYYFGAIYYYAPWFRQAAVGLLYSVGLAWSALCFIKAPIDRFQAGLGVIGMILLSGFLLSPTTNTKNLGSASGTELSVGGYYSFVLAGSLTGVFSEVLRASWKNSIVEAAGGGGPNKEALTLAFNDNSQKFADKFIQGEGRDAYVDYYTKCGSQALKYAKTPKEKGVLKSIGIGATTLGMSAADATTIAQTSAQAGNKNSDYGMAFATGSGDFYAGSNLLAIAADEAKNTEQNRSDAEVFLNDLPASANMIDGTKGYRIPTKEYYKDVLTENGSSNKSGANSFKTLSGSSGKMAEMLPSGLVKTVPNTEQDNLFYPKNCYDLYQVASQTMNSLREGSKGVPGYEQMPLASAYVAMSAANKVDRGIRDQMAAAAKEAGVDAEFDDSVWNKLANTFHSSMAEIGNEFNNFMLKFKIPAMVASMALLVATLLITFPVFALLSVVFGYKVLVTYLKLMALPFLVVFVNQLLLSMSANLISFNKLAAIIPETFNPGAVDVAGSMAMMNTETIIYTLICGCELVIAKLLLWDDVRAATSFSLGNVGTASASTGASLVSSAVSLVAGAFTRGAKLANAGKAAAAAKSTNNNIANISNAVQQLANGGRSQQRGNPLGGANGGGLGGSTPGNGIRPASGGGSPAGGGQNGGGGSPAGGGSPLNPPK